MSITAKVENDMIKLPAGIHLPDGTEVIVETLKKNRFFVGVFGETMGAATAGGETFERLLGEENALRAQMERAGRRFSAQGRLSRDEVHDRDALR